MEDFSTDVLALILAKIPLSKGKIQLQLVCKHWCFVLHQPAATSPDTYEDDESFPRPLSPGIANALSWLKLSSTVVSMAWLPPQLQALSVIELLEDCPVLPRVKHLFLNDIMPDNPAVSLAKLFPNLETVCFEQRYSIFPEDEDDAEDEEDWDMLHANSAEASVRLRSMLRDLESLSKIRYISVEASQFVDFNGPPNCRVSHKFCTGLSDAFIFPTGVPEGLSKHLKSFTFGNFDNVFVWRYETVFSLQFLESCVYLEKVALLFPDPGIQDDFHGTIGTLVTGLDTLPESCQEVTLEFVCQSTDKQPAMVKHAYGWDMTMPEPDFVEFRRVRP